MWELDCEKSWVPKNWCFWSVVLEKTLESPLDCKDIQPVHPKGDQPWVFFGRNDTKAETPVLWPPHVKSWLIGKDSVFGRGWGQEEIGTTEDEMAGWHHWLNGHEFEWTPGVGDGQGGLVCCSSCGCKELDTTELVNWTELSGTRCHDLSFLNVEFKPTFLLFGFTFIKRLFSSSSLSAIRVVSSAYLRLLTPNGQVNKLTSSENCVLRSLDLCKGSLVKGRIHFLWSAVCC